MNPVHQDGFLTETADPNLPSELLAHVPTAELAAHDNLARVKAAASLKIDSLQRQVHETQTPKVPASSKLIRIRHLAAEWSGVFVPYSACVSGCSHCCNINTAVPRVEARLISKAIGRPLSEPVVKYDFAESSQRQDFFGVPCTFLVAGKCSIYASRPLVCRTLVNMDSVNTLCKLVPGMQVPVPYLNTSHIRGYFGFLTQSEQYADLREWFPRV